MSLLPNLIIPGAPKAGTTSLCEYLSQHNEIFVPKIKEPRFFISDIIQKLPCEDVLRKYLNEYSVLSLEKYKALYEKKNTKYKCDASVQYLYYHEQVIPKIKSLLGEPKVVILLREPVSRAFSNYMYAYYKNKGSFEYEITLEEQRKKAGWNSFCLFLSQGFYYDAVKHYLDSFEKVKIILFEDFKKNTDQTVLEIFEFLELQPVKKIETSLVHNKSGVPRNEFVRWLVFEDNVVKRKSRFFYKRLINASTRQKITTSIRSKSVKKNDIEMCSDTYVRLKNLYREDILKLQDLLKKDLSTWLQ